ncbi:hypothetical protein Tco_0357025 [Tanacetum coccineum]
MANTTPIVTTVTKPATKEKTPKEADATPRVNIQDFCEEHYEDIMSVIMDKIRRDKRKEVNARLDFEESHRRQSAFDRLSDTYSPSTTKYGPNRANSGDRSHSRSRPHRQDSSNRDHTQSRDRSRGVEESYYNTRSSFGTGTKLGYRPRDRDCSRYEKRKGGKVNPRHPAYQRAAPAMGDTGSQGDPEDHVNIFQAAAQVERWAMPTWCHMFNSTLIGAARVWFDELPPESIDGYKDLKAAFLAYFMQQKKRMKGAPECMRISGFMHGVNNPELTKRLNEHVPKTMEEMTITTIAFIRGEAAAAGKKKGHTSWRTHDQSKWHASERSEAGKFKPPPPMVTPAEKRRNNKFCDFHNDKGHGSYEHYKSYRTDYELKEPGFELEDSKMGRNGSNSTRTPRIRASGLQGLDSFLHFCS